MIKNTHSQGILLPIIILTLGLIVLVILIWLLIRKPWDLWDITKEVDENDLRQAKDDAKASKSPILNKLPYTENNYRWVLLYNHAREGQIDPSLLKRMRRSDLEYLAGIDFPHPDLVEPQREKEYKEDAKKRHAQVTKLQGNVSRAKAELVRRNMWSTTAITALAVLGAGILGAFLATA